MTVEIEFKVRPCLRSGMCCKIATCAAGLYHGAEPKGCKFLRGGRPGEYSCGLVDDGTISPDILYVGAGCCSPMGNTERNKLVKEQNEQNSLHDRHRNDQRR